MGTFPSMGWAQEGSLSSGVSNYYRCLSYPVVIPNHYESLKSELGLGHFFRE